MKIERMLSDSESETLLNLSINHGGQDVRVRGAGLLRLWAGSTLMSCERVGGSHQSIYNGRHAWEEREWLG